MSIIPYSSFDPIFWLHHAYELCDFINVFRAVTDSMKRQVDRLFAIWQAIYPDSYTAPQVNDFGTFTDPPYSMEDINTGMDTISPSKRLD